MYNLNRENQTRKGCFLLKSFTDNKGRTWTIEVTVATIKRVRALCRCDLNSIVELDKSN